MKIRLDRKELVAGLQIVTTTIAETATDASAFILVRHSDTGIRLFSSSNQAFSAVSLKAEVEGDIEMFTIPGKRIRTWLSTVKDDQVELEWDTESKVVTARSSFGEAMFRPIGPKWFEGQDKVLGQGTKTGTVSASELHAAVSHLKLFLDSDDTNTPQFCVTEVKDGILYASDKGGVTGVKVNGLTRCQFRIHQKNTGALLKFLKTIGQESLEVFESKKSYVFKSESAYFGEIKSPIGYGGPAVVLSDAPLSWTLDKQDTNRAIDHLWASADWTDPLISLSPKEGAILVEVESMTGHSLSVKVEAELSGDQIDHALVHKAYFQKVLSLMPEDKVTIGVIPKHEKKGGFMLFKHEDETNTYITLMAWKL